MTCCKYLAILLALGALAESVAMGGDNTMSSTLTTQPTMEGHAKASGLDQFLSAPALNPFPTDRPFERYCDVQDLIKSVGALDAGATLDFALQLAHGESVLLRPRKGLSVDDVLEVVLRIANENKDANALDRLKRAAKALARNELLVRLEQQQKLGSVARGADPGDLVSVADTEAAQFQVLRDVQQQISAAKIAGNAEHLKFLQTYVGNALSLSDAQREQLASSCKAASEQISQVKPNGVLAKLTAAARDCGMEGTWDTYYIAADGTRVDAQVSINGNQGTYDVPGCQGQLSMGNSSAPFGGGPMFVRGTWQFCNGQTGTFNWKVNGDSFTGTWAFSGGGGPARQWNGTRSGSGSNPDPNVDPNVEPNVDPSGPTDPTDPGDGAGLESFLGSTSEADNGSSLKIEPNGTVMLRNSSGMITVGRLQATSGTSTRAAFRVGNGSSWASIRVLNANQIQVGRLIFNRR